MKWINKKRGLIWTFLVASMILLVGCSSDLVDQNLKSITSSGNIMATSGTNHNWGNINIKGGKVKRVFDFKNDSNEDLILKDASTSCMCTKARYRLPDNSISPQYGMRQGSSSWVAKIKPGGTFGVEVFYDPMAHGPDAVGPIQRSVFLETSAKNNPKMELKVSGDVLYEKDYKAKKSDMPL